MRPGGFVLACSHLGNLEPPIVGTVAWRKIDWMSRIEFFRHPLASRALYALDAFPVKRFSVSVESIRTAVQRAKAGRIIGVFPEGGVTLGMDSVVRGGPIKKGACVIANRAGVPILPVVVVGTDKLSGVGPWLPFKRARAWVIFGRPIRPHVGKPRKAARDALARELQAEFQAIYQELCATCGIDDKTVGWGGRSEPGRGLPEVQPVQAGRTASGATASGATAAGATAAGAGELGRA